MKITPVDPMEDIDRDLMLTGYRMTYMETKRYCEWISAVWRESWKGGDSDGKTYSLNTIYIIQNHSFI